jgi:hypothetical protein
MEESPYGHEYPVLDALADWVNACDPYTAPLHFDDITDEMHLALAKAARTLAAAIIDLVPYAEHEDEGNSLWQKAYNTRATMRDLTGQFLLNDYTDSNTDEPCDVEWNVTGLVQLVDPTYQRPDEIQPAYVGYLIDEGPKED